MSSRHQVDLSTRFSAVAPQPATRPIEYASGDLGREDNRVRVTLEREPYVAGAGLADAVNLAIALGRPLLLQGDPGVGKTRLAHAVAYALGLPLEEGYVKSTSRAQDLLYTYDAVTRLYDAQLPGERGKNAIDYIRLGPLGRAIVRADQGYRSVVLIDEIDKADIDFPNDLLHELDQLSFTIPEAGERARFEVPAGHPEWRPIVIVTNNEEKALPAAFLRRCVFHYIEFPAGTEQLSEILAAHEAGDLTLREEAIAILRQLRGMDLAKKPGLSELLDWVSYLQATGGKPADENGDIPHLGALLKQRDDQRRVREQRDRETMGS